MTKTILAAAALLLTLSACASAVDAKKYEMDCRSSGGDVSYVGQSGTCIKDGVKIGEWVDYKR